MLLCLCGLLLGLGSVQKAVAVEEEEQKTVVESNHFYSNYELYTNYDINSVEKAAMRTAATRKALRERPMMTSPSSSSSSLSLMRCLTLMSSVMLLPV